MSSNQSNNLTIWGVLTGSKPPLQPSFSHSPLDFPVAPTSCFGRCPPAGQLCKYFYLGSGIGSRCTCMGLSLGIYVYVECVGQISVSVSCRQVSVCECVYTVYGFSLSVCLCLHIVKGCVFMCVRASLLHCTSMYTYGHLLYMCCRTYTPALVSVPNVGERFWISWFLCVRVCMCMYVSNFLLVYFFLCQHSVCVCIRVCLCVYFCGKVQAHVSMLVYVSD